MRISTKKGTPYLITCSSPSSGTFTKGPLILETRHLEDLIDIITVHRAVGTAFNLFLRLRLHNPGPRTREQNVGFRA